jgi:hypothetical protein
MKLCWVKSLFLPCIAALSFGASATAHCQTNISLKKELIWSLPGNEIASPQFSADGNFMVVVSRVHWPDGEEAESLPKSVFDKLEQRRKQEPRFADPIIRLIDRQGNSVCEIRYGTNPSVAPDNNTIVFSRQRNPITAMRTLAATQAGNDVQLFDCEKKQATTVAAPQSGYFDNPVFLPDGHSVAYTVNEAVNGAMGGSVAVERVDLNGPQSSSLLSKNVVPGVPCPSAGSVKMTPFQSMMCSQTTKLSSIFPTLVLNPAMADDQLLVLLAKPIPSAGDMYLASHYELSLAALFPKPDEIFSMGQFKMSDLWDGSFQTAGDGTVMIYLGYWKPFSLRTREWLTETAPRNTNRRSIYSPNGKYYIAVEPIREEPSRFTLYRTADGQRLFTSPTMTHVFDVAWSRDSMRLAVVGVPKGISGSAYREILTVYRLP